MGMLQKVTKIYIIRDIKMKLIHKLFQRMINKSQGYSSIYTKMAQYFDVPVLSMTLGIIIIEIQDNA